MHNMLKRLGVLSVVLCCACGGGGESTTTNSTSAETAPVIASFLPASGVVDTSVVITGTRFTGAGTVIFGGVEAATFTVDSDTQITATVPTGASTGSVAVSNASGTATSSEVFKVLPVLVLQESKPCTPQRLLLNLAAYEAHPFDGVFL